MSTVIPLRRPLLRRDVTAASVPPRLQEGGLDIRLDRVAKRFGERTVLQDLTLELRAGEFLAVVGRSGGGKSTLLRLLAGLDQPSAGTVEVGGERVAGLQRHTRLLFQDARLLPWQTVLSNVGIARGPRWRDEARGALEDVGLADRAGEWPSVLSGGQRQRVALARALVSKPGVLLLDEPFGALDALTRADMHVLLNRIRAARGFTTVLITHDVTEAVLLADRVMVLREGCVALDAEIDLPRPRSFENGEVASYAAQILREV